jgi:c(7)-type cytochrome triheme protein
LIVILSNWKSKLLWKAPLFLLFALLGMAPVLGEEAPGDIRFEREGEEAAGPFPPSLFQHWKHRIHYRCDACHNELFRMEQGSTEIRMEQITAGESCGSCHNGQVAFDSSVSNCGRCHAQAAE